MTDNFGNVKMCILNRLRDSLPEAATWGEYEALGDDSGRRLDCFCQDNTIPRYPYWTAGNTISASAIAKLTTNVKCFS